MRVKVKKLLAELSKPCWTEAEVAFAMIDGNDKIVESLEFQLFCGYHQEYDPAANCITIVLKPKKEG